MAKDDGMQEAIKKLRERRAQAKVAAGEQKIAEVHQKGLLTARERIEALLDPSTFCEQYPFAEPTGRDFGLDRRRYPGDGVIVGWGDIDRQRVYVTANDSLVMGGSGSSSHIRKMALTIDQAVKNGSPLIQLNDSSGGRIQEGADKTSYALSVFYSNTLASGVIPQITAILGRCAGYAVYGAALTDFVFVVEGLGEMFITGPAIIREITGEEITFDKLGGAKVCTQVNGAADFLVANEQECFQQIRRLLSFFPPNCRELPPDRPNGDLGDRLVPELEDLVPSNPQRAYDIRKVIKKIVDDGDFMEAKADFGKNIVIGFARMGGQSIGIVANQPMFLGGSLTVDSSDKSARFIRFCDA
ncbi:MAG: carboxyl transferase domain-containing protein, partial [Pseudomonadota bacterium]